MILCYWQGRTTPPKPRYYPFLFIITMGYSATKKIPHILPFEPKSHSYMAPRSSRSRFELKDSVSPFFAYSMERKSFTRLLHIFLFADISSIWKCFSIMGIYWSQGTYRPNTLAATLTLITIFSRQHPLLLSLQSPYPRKRRISLGF